MKKLSFAIIGCGRISYKHIDAIIENNDLARLIATCDIVIDKAHARSKEYLEKLQKKITDKDCDLTTPLVCDDYKYILANKDIDIVSICTESGKHAEIAIEALKSGKHVLVEKPMALSTKDADEMIYLAKSKNLKLGVCHQNRFNPPIQELRQAIDEGRFGKIFAVTARILWNRNKEYYTQASWRGTFDQDGGCLMNQCIHNIDLLQWMVGQPIKEINGLVNNYTHPYIQAEDYGSIQLEFIDGTIGNIEGTVVTYPQNLEETLTVLGEKGTVVIGGKAVNEILVWNFEDRKDDLNNVLQSFDNKIENIYGNGHIPLYTDFMNSIKEDTEPLINGKEGKIAMSIILHSYLSSKYKKRVKFDINNIMLTKQGVKEI
ncbi:Gfo/Idh/MocA family protein [Sporosalibacterium faouarense]|uniref:Gfo/Idh/MocA family protein n=1 Tax=Sporosalibacterium faouarense TaxID=516123 RepID=UPI00192B396C|nr:Gfo/Idh/MocA family oxidoreductase [Sporosalibacterium faouarense]